MRICRPEDYRYYNIDDWAWQAYDEGDYPKAATLAQEFLQAAQERPKTNTGNAIHEANQILGLVALHYGDINEAKAYLIKAGSTSGSPQLDSYGPRMILARELLTAGERQTVQEYLDLVARFWTHETLPRNLDFPVFREENAKKAILLKQWKMQVHRGIVPDHPQWIRPVHIT